MNPLLLPLSAGFRFGVALRQSGYRHGWLKTRRLSRPVISVGNLTVGGTGKTPLVAYVANILLRLGRKPGILTRGYGRTSKDEMIQLPPGADRRVNAKEAGDEPALLARMLPEVPIVVCADRFRAGKAAEERFAVDFHILDDGFQHWALARDVDILTLDATQSISDWNVLPAGRQREPISALRRAQMIVLTRTDSSDPLPLEELVAKIHPGAKIFRSRTKLVGWAEAFNGQIVPPESLRGQKVAAFCGIGNPRAFFGDLRRWEFNLISEDAFPDHHDYTREDVERLARAARNNGAAALLTTQKDAVKLSEDWSPDLPVLACAIEAELPAAREFEATLRKYLEEAH